MLARLNSCWGWGSEFFEGETQTNRFLSVRSRPRKCPRCPLCPLDVPRRMSPLQLKSLLFCTHRSREIRYLDLILINRSEWLNHPPHRTLVKDANWRSHAGEQSGRNTGLLARIFERLSRSSGGLTFPSRLRICARSLVGQGPGFEPQRAHQAKSMP